MDRYSRIIGIALLCGTLTFAGCGGGGNGSAIPGTATSSALDGTSPSPHSTPNATPTSQPAPQHSAVPAIPAPTPTAASLTGVLIDAVSQAQLRGFTVTLGSDPDANTCFAGQTSTTDPCGSVASPSATTLTASDGSYSVTGAAVGPHLLTIGKDGTYATLHRSVTLVPGSNTIGTSILTALDANHQAWLADFNNRRQTVSIPSSYPNLVVDEYAQEQSTAWALALTQQNILITDASFGPYQSAYDSAPGSLYSAAGVLAQITQATPVIGNYGAVDPAWFDNEKLNCPNGNWTTCPFSDDTGHYINGSNKRDVWVGLGYAPTASATGTQYYDVLIVMNQSGPIPSASKRFIPKGR